MQTLMRHSSPVLSLGIYVHRDKNRERGAVAALPQLLPAKAQDEDEQSTKPEPKSMTS